MGTSKKYIAKEIKPREDEQVYFDHYNPADLQEIVELQYKVIEYQKTHDHKQLFQIAIFIDDFAESQEFLRNSKMLHALYTKGRHANISTITSVQMYKSLAPIIRKNATAMFIFRLRNYGDMEAILDELSALADKKTIQRIYSKATEQPHNFLYINLMSHDINNMFYINFEKKEYVLINNNVFIFFELEIYNINNVSWKRIINNRRSLNSSKR